MQTAWITMSKALHRKKPSRSKFKLLLFLLRKLEIHLKTMDECLFVQDSKVIVDAAAMFAVSSDITSGIPC